MIMLGSVLFHSVINISYSLNVNLFSAKILFSIGIVLFPIPCKAKTSFSLSFDSFSNVVIPSLSKARLAGAAMNDKKLSLGLRSSSQKGQVGQLLLLKN